MRLQVGSRSAGRQPNGVRRTEHAQFKRSARAIAGHIGLQRRAELGAEIHRLRAGDACKCRQR